MHDHEMYAPKTHVRTMHSSEAHAGSRTPLRYARMRCTFSRCKLVRYMPLRYTPRKCTPIRSMSEVHAHEIHAYDVHAIGDACQQEVYQKGKYGEFVAVRKYIYLFRKRV